MILALLPGPETVRESEIGLTPSPAPPSPLSGEEASLQDNHFARREYELMKLADPKTGRIPPDIHRLEQQFAAKLLPAWGNNNFDKAVGGLMSRGPWNVGGRTRALAIDTADPTFRTLLAGGVSGGMWRTTDDGISWNLTTGSSQLHSVTTVAQDSRVGHQNVWYYGTGEATGSSATWPTLNALTNGDGLFKSTDGGVSWSQIPATSGHNPEYTVSPWQFVYRVETDPSELVEDEVYAATWGHIFRSIDGGNSFTPVLGDPNTKATYTDVAVTATGVVYATMSYNGGMHGAFRSVDGVNWTDITPPGYADYDRIVITPAPSNENIVWFLVSNSWNTADAALFRYQYLSGDGSGAGGDWDDRSTNLASLPWNGGTTYLNNYDNYCQMVTVHPDDPERVFLGGVNLFRGYDGFQSPSSISWIGGWQYGNHHADQHWMVFQPGSATVAYTGSDGGIHKTSDVLAPAVSWTSLNNGYNTSQFFTVAIDENLPDSPVIVGGMQDNGTWFSGQDLANHPWTEVHGGDGGFCAVADASGVVGTYYISSQRNYGVYKRIVDNTTGAKGAWARVDPTGGTTSLFLKPFILDPNDTRMMYLAAEEVVWRNSDLDSIPNYSNATASKNWTTLTSGAPGVPVTALAMSRSTNRILYFGNTDGQVYRLYNADTAGAGSVPTRLDVGAGFPAGAYVSSIAVHPQDDQQVLVAFSNYNIVNIFYSDDGGASWTDVEGNLGGPNSPSVRSVAFMPAMSVDFYFAATSTGLYSSYLLDGAATEWFHEGAQSIGNVVVDMVVVRPEDALVVAATHGRGVFRGYLGATDVPAGPASLSTGIRLDPNVPNPFNPRTTISYGLADAGFTTVRIYDVSGRQVKSLFEGFRNAGDHNLIWQGEDDGGRPLGSGVYICRVKSGQDEQVRSMTLVR
jgi:hypothetical protein